MESESMFAGRIEMEQNEPVVVIKMETSSSTAISDSLLDRSTPTPMQPMSNPTTPISQHEDLNRAPINPVIPTKQANEREQIKMRLATKSQEVKAAKNWLQGFPEWLHPKERNIPEVGDWIEDIKAIFKHSEMPRVFLGFMGPSGCGKSSVLNALLDEESLLPCNCMEACTAVAVEIAWNPIIDDNKAYRAKIQFVTAAEWKAELDLLVAELMSLEPEARLNPNTEEGKVAAAKIKAVYPDLEIDELTEQSAGELMNDAIISEWLGECVEISMPVGKGKKFSAEIRQYIDSSPRLNTSAATSRNVAPYWPLVKVVQIFVKSLVLRTGLILVDLPGSGDSNAARAAVSADYLQKVSAICIVADIKRALTNSVARNLFGRGTALKRRLLRDGLLDDAHTFFVLTLTDIISNQQVIATQGLLNMPAVSQLLQQKQIKQRRSRALLEKKRDHESRLQKSLTALKELRKEIKGMQSTGIPSNPRVNKRKHTDDARDTSDPVKSRGLNDLQHALAQRQNFNNNIKKAIENLGEEVKTINNELALMEDDLAAICIRERNSYVTSRMKEDFSLGLRDLEEDLMDEGDEAANSVLQPTVSSSRNSIHTFCVCSKAFQKLRNRFPLEQMPSGFKCLDDTSMPQLYRHCREFTLNAREQLADDFLEDLTRLRQRMRGWADNTVPDKEITIRQKALLQANFELHKEKLKKVVLDNIDSVAKQLYEELIRLGKRARKYAVRTAALKASETFSGWTHSVHNVNAWKAVCRKEGIHVGRANNEKVEYNWNDDLAEELTKLMDRGMAKLTGQSLPALQKIYTTKMQEVMNDFAATIQSSSIGITNTITNSVQHLFHTLERLQAGALRDIGCRFTLARTMSRVADRKISPAIRAVMKTGYATAKNFTGRGSFQRSKDVIESHIEDKSPIMYTEAAKELLQALDDAIALLKNNLQKDFDTNINQIENVFDKMIQLACETPRPETGPAKVELQEEVLVKLSYFDKILGEFQSQTSQPIIIEDLDDIDEMKDAGDEKLEEDSENELGDEELDIMGKQDEFAGMLGADDMNFDCSGLEDPDANANEDFGGEITDETVNEETTEEALNQEIAHEG